MNNEILVIDDNSDIRFLICNILKESGHTVRYAANYEQAVTEIKKSTCHNDIRSCQRSGSC